MITRLSAMGDVAIAVRIVAALREHFPGLRITLLTSPEAVPFFRDIPSLDFVTPDFNKQYRGLRGLARLVGELAAQGIDAMADLQRSPRTRRLGRLLRLRGARIATLREGRREKRSLTRKFRKNLRPLTPALERYSDVLTRLGLPVGVLKPLPRAPRPLSGALRKLFGTGEGIRIGVAPFAAHAGKVYPTILMDSLIGLLSERYAKVFLFGGGPQESVFATHMAERHKRVVSVMGRLKLGEELDLISNLDCMVTMDSVAQHMASLVGTPVVSIWGQTHPYAGFYGLGQQAANAVQLDMPCRPCSITGERPCMLKDFRCLQRIPATAVFEQVNRVVSKQQPASKIISSEPQLPF